MPAVRKMADVIKLKLEMEEEAAAAAAMAVAEVADGDGEDDGVDKTATVVNEEGITGDDG